MRTILTLLASIALLSTSAQVDINKMMQERMARQGQDGSKGAGGSTTMVDDTDPFVPNEFIGSFRMEMHSYTGTTEEKNSPMNVRYWSSADMTLNAVQMPEQRGQQMRMLTDLKGKWSYMLMTDEKGKKTAMKSPKKKVVGAGTASGKQDPVITMTKETKMIEGHTCTKVIVVSEDGTWTGWVAEDVKAPFTDMTRSMQQRGDQSHVNAMRSVQGMPLEFEWVPTDGKSRMVCYVKELEAGKVDTSVFSLDGYEVMEMPSFGH